jgi:hypothetical protein
VIGTFENPAGKGGYMLSTDVISEIYTREYWTGDSRDGAVVNGDGYHYYRMTKDGLIREAYEFYETDDGLEVASPLPEMLNVDWVKDLGFEDLEALDIVDENEFYRVRGLTGKKGPGE